MRQVETYRETLEGVTEVYCGFDRMTEANRRLGAEGIAKSDSIHADSLLIYRQSGTIRFIAFPISTLGIPWIRLENNGRLLRAGIWYDGDASDAAIAGAVPLIAADVDSAAEALIAAVEGSRRGPGHHGWCSWYQYFTGVTEEAILDTVKRAEALEELSVVQIDMGYAPNVGDWLTPGEGFSRPITEVIGDISDAGLVPGVWLAPFSAEETSDFYQAHPDWFYADDTYPWKREQPPWKCLDLSIPEAVQAIVDIVRDLHEAGARYFKLDFIDMALVAGGRRSTEHSGVELYRNALSAVRSAAPDSFILGCNPLFSATMDLVDGLRIGEDTAPRWFPGDGSVASTHRSLQTGLGRTYLRQATEIDLDCMLLRREASSLSAAEITTAVNAIVASGEQRIVSDDLALVDQTDLDRAFRPVPYPGRLMLPARPLDEDQPSDFNIFDGSTRIGKLLCNWGEGELCIVPFLAFGPEASEYVNSETGEKLGSGEICLKPHQSVFAIRERS